MPRQLKVLIVPPTDPSENRIVNAPFTVNFAAPIIIEPGNKITLDKFSAVVDNISSNFAFLGESFTFYYDLNGYNGGSATVAIPSGGADNYASVTELLNAISIGCNNSFSSWFSGVTETLAYNQRGLKVGCATSSVGNAFQMQYVTSPVTELGTTFNNMSIDSSGNWSPTETGEWALIQVNANNILLQGGGFSTEFQIMIPEEFEIVTDESYWNLGYRGVDGSEFGIGQDVDNEPQLYLYNQPPGDGQSLIKTAIPSSYFTRDGYHAAQIYCQFYQNNGLVALRTFVKLNDGSEISNKTTAVDYPGALGNYNILTSYIFSAQGNNQADPIIFNVPKINHIINTTLDVPFGASAGLTPLVARTVAFDMTTAPELRSGLAVPAGLITLSPQNSDYGSYTSTSSVNMSSINRTFDLAIEVFDLPLQTYQATSNRDQGSRQNIIAYFTPTLSNVGTSTYYYTASCYQWLDIDISYPLNISSLSFRVFNPNNGVDLQANSMSFNLMINTNEY